MVDGNVVRKALGDHPAHVCTSMTEIFLVSYAHACKFMFRIACQAC